VLSPHACPHPQQAYGYYASGSDDEWTLRENREALARYRLLPRMLVDVSAVDTSTHLFGEGANDAAMTGWMNAAERDACSWIQLWAG
jgi:isopentenyl diphosphate isomerase/L-lactate dehydrogenase-like FMN-dependent dehydrogenase